MSSDPSHEPATASRSLGAARHLAFLAVFVAWFLLLLRDQYGVPALAPYEGTVDLAFLLSFALLWIVSVAQFRSPAVARRLLGRMALLLVALTLSLVASEYALRYALRNVHSSADTHDWVSVYNHGPQPRGNSEGRRDPETPPRTDRYRIVIVGDSFTFGNGLEEKDRVSNLLAAELGPRFEVLNYGFPGNNMPDHLDVLARALAARPDFVLLQLFVNDWELPDMKRTPAVPLLPPYANARFHERSVAYDLLSRGWGRVQEMLGLTESYDHYLARYLADPNSPESSATTSMLRQFFERTRAARVGVGAFMYPFIDEMGRGGSYPLAFLHKRMLDACGAEDVRCVDLYPDFAKIHDRGTLKVTPLDGHPSALANKHATAVVVAAFGDSWNH